MLNEIDAELTRRGLAQHLVFIVYTDTFWPPLTERLHNQKRFTMLYAPITRKYTESYDVDARMESATLFHLNANVAPKDMAECLAYLHEWKKIWPGDCFCYEYHFWIHQYFEPTGLYIAERIYHDIQGLRKHGLRGIVEDGSQRSFFPTGFAFYVYGETLFDVSRSFEELEEDYFSHAFGKKWREVLEYLKQLKACFTFPYLSGSLGGFKDPEIGAKAARVHEIVEGFAQVIAENKDQARRASSVAWRLLDAHRGLIGGIATCVEKRAEGDEEGAFKAQERLMQDFSAREVGLEQYFDLFMFWWAYRHSGFFKSKEA